MRAWLDEPKLIPVRDKIVLSLTPKKYQFRRVDPVIFICGGQGSVSRDTLRDYLRKRHPNLNIFYAERVWEAIAASPGLGSLKMESDLAAFSDIVIIIVESPGTFAELGAFSHVKALRKKLLPVVDIKHQGANSFVNTGPLRWIDQESDFGPTIWCPLDKILVCSHEVDQRIQRIPRASPSEVSDLSISRKHLLFFICDLVGVIAPATIATIEYFLGEIIPKAPPSDIDVPMLVGLAEAMGLLRKDILQFGPGRAETFFSAADPGALGSPYHRIKWIDLPNLRSEYLSKLLIIPEALQAMREVSAHR